MTLTQFGLCAYRVRVRNVHNVHVVRNQFVLKKVCLINTNIIIFLKLQ